MRAILAVVALTGLVGWLALTAPQLAFAALTIAGLAALGGALLLRPLAHAVRDVRRERGRVSAFASERLAASATILACARGASEAGRLAGRVERLNRAALRRAWLTGLLRALPHLATTAIVIAAVLAAGNAPASGMAGTVLVIGIIGLALRDLARAAELTVPGRISLRRIETLLALPQLERAQPAPWQRGEARSLVLAGLKLERGGPPLSACARRGDVIGIDGDPGQSRALFQVIAGLASPASGAVRWNGSDLIARAPARRRRIVGLASAELPLLRGSNALNLRYRLPGATVEEIAELAECWDIDPEASEGNRAHLVLARALAGKPPVLLLAPDELALDDAGALHLALALKDWPGVVLIRSRHPMLTRIMTRHWTLDSDGLVEQPNSAGPALEPVRRERRA
jgi:ABC-type multidrug transport system fused ATPase/permease subunit